MRAVVVGAGAWGLPTAAELARRGHRVTLVDRYEPGNVWSSSSGPTRLWRLADPDPADIRLGRRALEALRRLERRLGEPLHTRSGLVWRDADGPLRRMRDAVVGESVPHTEIPAGAVGEFFPGLGADGRDALWFPDAGAVLADRTIAGYLRLFQQGGGRAEFGSAVASVRTTTNGAAVTLVGGRVLDADVAVVCAGPGTPALLPGIGLGVPLRPFLEQVVHVRGIGPADEMLPCLFDGPGEHGPGVYSMPTPGVGYKLGIDDPLRALGTEDLDRAADPARTADILAWAADRFRGRALEVVDEQVCCWTDSPDGSFVIDRADAVVVACGDSGKGFKYSPAIGEILADLAEGGVPDPDVAARSARRFEGLDPDAPWTPTGLGGG